MRSLFGWAVCCALVTTGGRRLDGQERTTVGGYGEVHYTNATGPNTPGRATLRRFVVYLAHSFDDRLSVRSELEVEDARVEPGGTAGELEIEQAFLDYRLPDWLTLRTGLVLVPVGIINETHEPPTFNGVARPGFDNDVLPTTWREIGIGAAGTIAGAGGGGGGGGGGLAYRGYVVNGLRAQGFAAGQGIREGRQEGQDATFANPSVTGRPGGAGRGLKLGGSFWYGGSAGADSVLGSASFDAPVALVSADARYDVGAASFRAVVANISLRDAGAIDARYGTAVGSRLPGGHVEGALNGPHPLPPPAAPKPNALARHQRHDTPAG